MDYIVTVADFTRRMALWYITAITRRVEASDQEQFGNAGYPFPGWESVDTVVGKLFRRNTP